MPPSIGLFRDIVIGKVNMWDDLMLIAILNEYSELLDRLAKCIIRTWLVYKVLRYLTLR